MGFETGDGGTAGSGTMLTPQRAVITDTLGALTTSVTTSTEISYVSGVTSSIQTQLNGKQPTGNYITALTGDVGATGPGSVTATIQPGVVDNGKLANGAVDNNKVAVGAAIARTKLASGTVNHVLINDGSGVMSSEAQLALSRGGTNKNNTAVAGGVAYSDASGILIGAAGTSGQVLVSAGAAAPVWTNVASIATAPTIQRFTSGSGTYTTPAGVKYIRVKMVGGGGGGAGSGTAGGGNGGTGGASTFGSSLLTSNGGVGGAFNAAGSGGLGGSVTVNSPAVTVIGLTGGAGQSGWSNPGTTLTFVPGGKGASSFFGGAGGGTTNAAGNSAIANSGSGGGGAGLGGTGGGTNGSGAGGGAGGYIEALIISPSATYSYAVGSSGTAGSAGTNGYGGGAGGSGIIIVEEYYA